MESKNIIIHSISNRNYAAAYYQTLEEDLEAPSNGKKIKNIQKLDYLKKLLEFVILNS